MIVNKTKYCKTLEEFNYQLKVAKNICFAVFFEKYTNQPIAQNAFVETTEKYFKLTYKLAKKKITYIFDRNGETKEPPNVLEIMSEVGKQVKPQKAQDILPEIKFNTENFEDNKPIGYRESVGSASPIRSYNKKFVFTGNEAFEYDLRTAYAQFLVEDLPDLTTIKYDTKLKAGQIGFMKYGCSRNRFPRLNLVLEPGVECDYVFEPMKSPYINWVEKNITKLNKAATKDEEDKIKDKFRIAVGCLQNTNPWWRATIVEKCNRLVKYFKNDSTIYWSTDSIISATERPDILNSKYIWQVKHSGIFKLANNFRIQWNDETPKVNGVYKRYIEYYNMTHEKKFDILTDTMPVAGGSLYVLDPAELKVKLNPEVQKCEDLN